MMTIDWDKAMNAFPRNLMPAYMILQRFVEAASS